jgi:DNA-binding response OmpR family regulator
MGATVLVADDDEPIRRMLSHRLEGAGYEVHLCDDGQAAADLLKEGLCPEVLVLDVMMPRLNGTRLLRMVRNEEFPVDSSVPVIILSSRAREDDVLEGFESGANDYITKPFRGNELLARVRRYLDD